MDEGGSMSTDLKSQIHAYGSQLVGDQTAIAESDVTVLVEKVREFGRGEGN